MTISPSLIPAHTSRARLASASRAVSLIANRGRKLCRSKRKWHLAAALRRGLRPTEQLGVFCGWRAPNTWTVIRPTMMADWYETQLRGVGHSLMGDTPTHSGQLVAPYLRPETANKENQSDSFPRSREELYAKSVLLVAHPPHRPKGGENPPEILCGETPVMRPVTDHKVGAKTAKNFCPKCPAGKGPRVAFSRAHHTPPSPGSANRHPLLKNAAFRHDAPPFHTPLLALSETLPSTRGWADGRITKPAIIAGSLREAAVSRSKSGLGHSRQTAPKS